MVSWWSMGSLWPVANSDRISTNTPRSSFRLAKAILGAITVWDVSSKWRSVELSASLGYAVAVKSVSAESLTRTMRMSNRPN